MKEQVDCNSQKSLKEDRVDAKARELQATQVQNQELVEELCEKSEIQLECVSNDVILEREQEIEKSRALNEEKEEKRESALILSFNKNESEGTHCYSNNLSIALSSVPYFMQVKQSAITLILQYSIPKSFVQFVSFHGVCLLRVRSIWCPLMKSDDCKVVHILGGSNYVHL